MSFFDDDEDEPPRSSPRSPRPRPRSPQQAGGARALDQHALMVRRRVAAGVGVVLLIVIVLVVNGCLQSRKQQALKDYNQNATQIVKESDEQVSRPLFSELAAASGKAPLDVEVQIDQLRQLAKTQAAHAASLSVPGGMSSAQRNLTLLMNLRSEGLAKIASLVRTALGGQGQRASTLIAGDMEIFLTSDVLYSQRVAPLIAQTLASSGIHEEVRATSNFLPNLGWLEPATVLARITGQGSSNASKTAQVAPGTHGHAVTGVSVGPNTLQAQPTLNHISGGANPTFTVMVQNGGSNAETSVKVEVAVTSGGKQLKASHVINKTQPESTVSVDIPVNGVSLNVASKITVYVQPVPGETNIENNKQTYLAVFGS